MIDLNTWGLFDMPKVKDLLMPILSINGDNYPEVRGGLGMRDLGICQPAQHHCELPTCTQTLAQMVVVNAPAMFDPIQCQLPLAHADPGPDGRGQCPCDVRQRILGGQEAAAAGHAEEDQSEDLGVICGYVDMC